MKKILNEWKRYLKETERKHPSRDRRVSHDRTATKYMQQRTETGGDPKAELKYYISNVTYHAADPRSREARIKDFIDFLAKSDMRDKLLEDLKIIQFLLSPKNQTKYSARSNDGKLIFDDTGPIIKNADLLLKYIIIELGESPIKIEPPEADLGRVFFYYIAPTNKIFWPAEFKDPEPAPKTGRFSNQMTFSADELARRNYELYLKNRRADDK